MQILLYDDKEMHIFDVVGYYPEEIQPIELDVTTIEYGYSKRAIAANSTYRVEIHTGEVKAELDPTTMKRIAKYNLDKEFEELNKKIKSAEEFLKYLNEQIESKEEKLKFIEELLYKIWNDPCFDQEKYLPDEDDYEEDY